MNIYIKKFLPMLLLPLVVGTLNGCGNKTNKAENVNIAAAGHEGAETEDAIVTLTAVQIKEVGIQLGDIQMKQLDATIRANGVLRVPNDNKGNVTSLYGGVIRTLHVQVGDYVRKGQTVATIANPQFVQLQEEYLTIDSRVLLAEQELQRQQELNAGNAGAGKNLQAATAELNTLRTRKGSIVQQLRLMGVNPAQIANGNLRSALPVVSPITGTVSNMLALIGSYVDASVPIVEIINNSSLHLDLQVFEKDLPKMKVGQTVHFNLTNNPETEYDAKVFSVGASFENNSKTIAVHARVLGSPKGLIDGMNITGMISLDNVTTMAIPNEAIVEAEGKFFIFMQTNKREAAKTTTATAHAHTKDEGQADHEHEDTGKYSEERSDENTFERVEIIKGVSNMGFTGITPVKELPRGAKIVVKGAFFINAKMNNAGGHGH